MSGVAVVVGIALQHLADPRLPPRAARFEPGNNFIGQPKRDLPLRRVAKGRATSPGNGAGRLADYFSTDRNLRACRHFRRQFRRVIRIEARADKFFVLVHCSFASK